MAAVLSSSLRQSPTPTEDQDHDGLSLSPTTKIKIRGNDDVWQLFWDQGFILLGYSMLIKTNIHGPQTTNLQLHNQY